MKKYDWTADKLQMAKKLLETHTARSVGEVMGVSRNAVLGALYRDKVKNGYIPPANSPYARIRKYRKGFA
jgi:hypothetical protein